MNHMRKEAAAAAHRGSRRITPPCVIACVVGRPGDSTGAIGVISDISRRGARICTDIRLPAGASVRLQLTFAFASPPEQHEAQGRVVWARDVEDGGRKTAECGVKWLSMSQACIERLEELTSRAVAPDDDDLYPFEKRWRVKDGWLPRTLDEVSNVTGLILLDPEGT